MKESGFKSQLSKGIRKLNPNVKVVSVSDRYTGGISDLLIWYAGSSLAAELKYVQEFKGNKLLKHLFTKLQIQFIRDIIGSDNSAFGVLGTKDRLYIIPLDYLTINDGQVYRKDLELFKCIRKQGKEWKIVITKDNRGRLQWECAHSTCRQCGIQKKKHQKP